MHNILNYIKELINISIQKYDKIKHSKCKEQNSKTIAEKVDFSDIYMKLPKKRLKGTSIAMIIIEGEEYNNSKTLFRK